MYLYIPYQSEIIVNQINSHLSLLENSPKDREDINIFFTKLFNDACSPYLFETDLLGSLLKEPDDIYLPLTKHDIYTLMIHYFKKYVETCQSAKDTILWNLFHSCKYPEIKDRKLTSKFIPEVVEEMRKFILEKDLDGYLEIIIHHKPFENSYFGITDGVKNVFQNYDNFKKTIYAQDESKWIYLKEFKNFIDSLDATEEYIQYKFETIPMQKQIK